MSAHRIATMPRANPMEPSACCVWSMRQQTVIATNLMDRRQNHAKSEVLHCCANVA